ncbi:hypothetical protein BKA62DRAFT_429451 [Auriculariales sp. MPI-PUGE-AT-0066]|nr:hypothetical protein BKA62DRAFT_429451 [Auriculariales sp. MPI-PUGE-AT-0066]
MALDTMPPELLLRIYSYLDVPDVAALGRTSRTLRTVAVDRALHRTRIKVVAPSRVLHALQSDLRPNVTQLCQRNLLRGLGIERRWRAGLYIYSPQSVKQFETSQRLQRALVASVLTAHIHHRPPTPSFLWSSRVLPDVEGSYLRIARALLPVVRKLKFARQCDELSRQVRADGGPKVDAWLQRNAARMPFESERVRLAMCPPTQRIVQFWESLIARQGA